MLDNKTAGLGHNNPPPYNPEELAQFDATVSEFLRATQQWLNIEAVETEEDAGKMADQITGLRGLWRKVDEARKAAKKPHDDAGTKVQTAFAPLLTKLQRAADALKPKLVAFEAERSRKEAEARAAREAEARRQAEEAERLAREAERTNDIGAQVEAEEAAKAAEQAQRKAQRQTSRGIQSASGGGRTMSVKKIKEVNITNINLLFMHFRDHPEVAATLKGIATAAVRAKDYDPASPIPGVEVYTRDILA